MDAKAHIHKVTPELKLFEDIPVYSKKFHSAYHSREARFLNYKKQSVHFHMCQGETNFMPIFFSILSIRQLKIPLHVKPSVKQRTRQRTW